MTTLTPVDTANIATEVAAVLSALREAEVRLPRDGSLPTPDERDANFVRRTSLSGFASRLDTDWQRLAALQQQRSPLTTWIAKLQACRESLEQRLVEAEDRLRKEPRSFRIADNLRAALRAIVNGPDYSDGQVVGPPVLFDTLGESFAGRGGLRTTEARLEELEADIASARTQVDASLMAAIALIG